MEGDQFPYLAMQNEINFIPMKYTVHMPQESVAIIQHWFR